MDALIETLLGAAIFMLAVANLTLYARLTQHRQELDRLHYQIGELFK